MEQKISSDIKGYYLYFALAMTTAAIVLAWYVFSGQGSKEQSTRVIQNGEGVRGVTQTQSVGGANTVLVECDDGRKYEVYFPAGSTDFEALKANKCQ